MTALLDQEVDTELGPRGHRLEGVSGSWACRRCHESALRLFRRNGHYRRQIVSMEGVVTVHVPLIRCKCGGYVATPWKTLAPRSRCWHDVTVHGEREYLSGASYRKSAELVSELTGAQVSHMAAWRQMQKVGAVALESKGQLACPEVVILDEMYLWEKSRKRPVLLAIDSSGHILGFEGPTERSVVNWRRLLDRLSERGVSPDKGLKYVVADGDPAIRLAVQWAWGKAKVQNCIWHILVAVGAEARKVFGETSRKAKEVVAEARAVLWHTERNAQTVKGAAERLTAFRQKHAGQPWVDIVARGFAEALTYLESPKIPRTNGAAERAIKELRRRIKTMDGFKSHMGARHLLAVLIQWYNWWRDRYLTSSAMATPAQP